MTTREPISVFSIVKMVVTEVCFDQRPIVSGVLEMSFCLVERSTFVKSDDWGEISMEICGFSRRRSQQCLGQKL